MMVWEGCGELDINNKLINIFNYVTYLYLPANSGEGSIRLGNREAMVLNF